MTLRYLRLVKMLILFLHKTGARVMEQLPITAQATNIILTFRLINQDPNWQQTVTEFLCHCRRKLNRTMMCWILLVVRVLQKQ